MQHVTRNLGQGEPNPPDPLALEKPGIEWRTAAVPDRPGKTAARAAPPRHGRTVRSPPACLPRRAPAWAAAARETARARLVAQYERHWQEMVDANAYERKMRIRAEEEANTLRNAQAEAAAMAPIRRPVGVPAWRRGIKVEAPAPLPVQPEPEPEPEPEPPEPEPAKEPDESSEVSMPEPEPEPGLEVRRSSNEGLAALHALQAEPQVTSGVLQPQARRHTHDEAQSERQAGAQKLFGKIAAGKLTGGEAAPIKFRRRTL